MEMITDLIGVDCMGLVNGYVKDLNDFDLHKNLLMNQGDLQHELFLSTQWVREEKTYQCVLCNKVYFGYVYGDRYGEDVYHYQCGEGEDDDDCGDCIFHPDYVMGDYWRSRSLAQIRRVVEYQCPSDCNETCCNSESDWDSDDFID